MSREIVSLHVGNCGVEIGSTFWKRICEDHGIEYSSGKYTGESEIELERINTYMKETKYGYSPRSLLVDLDVSSLDRVKSSDIGPLFQPDCFVSGENGAGNVFGNGHYIYGAGMIDRVLDVVRKEVEEVDSLDGFQLHHSLGGGTGTGLGTLLIMKLREEYPSDMFGAFSVIPSSLVSHVVVEPYNCVLALHHLIDNSGKMCKRNLLVITPTYGDLNHLAANALWGATSTFHVPFDLDLNSDMRRFSSNLVPFSRAHFLSLSFSPVTTRGSCQYDTRNLEELTKEVFSVNNNMTGVESRFGVYLSATGIFRGNPRKMSANDVDEYFRKAKIANNSCFCDWIPNNFKHCVSTNTNPRSLAMTSTLISNSTSIVELFQRVEEKFSIMFRRKAFLHYGFGGMDEMEFQEAQSNLNDLISEYQTYSELSKFDEDDM